MAEIISKDLDKRVERSRRHLMSALLELMQESSYSKISVAQICERSGVARPTFYLHYRSKDDLLRGYIESMFIEFCEQIDVYLTAAPTADPKIAEIMFKQWSDKAVFAKLLVKDDIEALMLAEFKRYVDHIIRRFIEAHKLPVRDNSMLPYVVDFLAGASFMVVVRWIKDDFPTDAKTMGELYATLVRPGLLQVMLSGKL